MQVLVVRIERGAVVADARALSASRSSSYGGGTMRQRSVIS